MANENIQKLQEGIDRLQQHIDKHSQVREDMMEKYDGNFKLTAPTHLVFLGKIIKVLIEESVKNKHNGAYVYWLSSQINYFNRKKQSILKYFLRKELESEVSINTHFEKKLQKDLVV